MKHVFAAILLMLTSAVTPVCGTVPSKDSIDRIKEIVSELAKDLESTSHDSELKNELATLIAEYGIEGIVHAALNEPSLMEALVLSPSFGYEFVAIALVEVATNIQELEEMLVKLTSAQLNVGGEVDEVETRKIVEQNIDSSLISLGAGELNEMVSSAKTLAMNARATVEQASVVESQKLSERLADIVEETTFASDTNDRIISQVR